MYLRGLRKLRDLQFFVSVSVVGRDCNFGFRGIGLLSLGFMAGALLDGRHCSNVLPIVGLSKGKKA